MSTSFAGYLFKTSIGTTEVIFPLKYIAFETWETTPNQREEIKAYRDDNTRNLTRVTAAGRKSKISFSIRDGISLEQKIEIQKFFTDHETSADERKIQITYWNDEENAYKTGYFYRPNMTFKISHITDTTIYYKSFKIELIEY